MAGSGLFYRSPREKWSCSETSTCQLHVRKNLNERDSHTPGQHPASLRDHKCSDSFIVSSATHSFLIYIAKESTVLEILPLHYISPSVCLYPLLSIPTLPALAWSFVISGLHHWNQSSCLQSCSPPIYSSHFCQSALHFLFVCLFLIWLKKKSHK